MILLLASTAAPVHASAAKSSSSPDLSLYTQYLINPQDMEYLNGGCYYDTAPYVQTIGVGILARATLRCPLLGHGLENIIIFTPRVMNPGEGLSFLGYSDLYDYPLEVGSWSRSNSISFGTPSLTFTKGSAWVFLVGKTYVGDAQENFRYENTVLLGQKIAERLPEDAVSLANAQFVGITDQEVTQVSPDFYSPDQEPQFAFVGDPEKIIEDGFIEDFHFTVGYSQPHDTVLILTRQDALGERFVQGWQFEDADWIGTPILEPIGDSVLHYIELDREYFFRNTAEYQLYMWVDGVLVNVFALPPLTPQ